MKRIIGLLLCLSLLLALPGALAAEPAQGLLHRLPAAAFEAGWLSYADISALLQAADKPGLPGRPANVGRDAFFRAISGMHAGPRSAYLYGGMTGEVLKSSGIDLLSIHQGAEAGQPPTQQLWLQGALSLPAIRTALTLRGYVQAQEVKSGLELWHLPEGFDSGTRMDLAKREPTFIFGGDLGRSFPVMLSEDLVMASPDGELFRTLAEGPQEMLMDNAPLRELIEALTRKDGVLAQMVLVKPETTSLGAQPYEALAIAQVYTEKAQRVVLALALPDERSARDARDQLDRQIAEYRLPGKGQPIEELLSGQPGTGQPLTELIAEIKGSLQPIDIVPGTQARRSLLITIELPLDQPAGFAHFPAMLLRRELGWLSLAQP